MKKIVCLLLVLASVLCFAACGDNRGDGSSVIDKITGKSGTLATVSETVNSSTPTKIVTRTEYVGEDTLVGMYTTKIDRASGITQFDFEYQRYAKIEELLPSNVKTVSGTVYYNADGSVTDSEGETWSSDDALGYLPETLVLDDAGFSSYDIINDGNDLRGYVKASESKRVFGTAIDAEGDILLEIDTNGQYLYSIKVTYTAAGTGATVVVNTSYDYVSVSLG